MIRVRGPEDLVTAVGVHSHPEAPSGPAGARRSARVLAEVDARRQAMAPSAAALEDQGPLRDRIFAVLRKDHEEFSRLHRQESELIETERKFRPIVRVLALSYADHPDYREEWRPSR